MADVAGILAGAGHAAHLTREKAFTQLEVAIDEGRFGQDHDQALQTLQHGALDMVSSQEWEQRLGALRVAKVLISRRVADTPFEENALQACVDLLEDREVRVRWAVGDLLRALSEKLGIHVWEHVGDRILDSIRYNFDRDAEEPSSKAPAPTPSSATDAISSLLEQSYRTQPPGTGEMRHGTEGWKCLETSFRAVQHIMEGTGAAFKPRLTPELRSLIYRAVLHPNRFVREACHFILGSVCLLLEGPELDALAPEIAYKMGLGLSDNWSQVRYAASTATRTFVLASAHNRTVVLPLLVPHMCLNRYYVAEGVRLYSQETWRIVMGEEGRDWVARCAPQVVSYYVEQSKANNHAVREAACACIAELMCKVDRDAVAPHVPRLLRALVMCFKDASWPVRDAACVACGRCVTAFPEESREVLENLYSLWFAHLWDNIHSVREDSAVALGDSARAYGNEAISRILTKIEEMLPMAKDQPEDSHARGGLENTTLFGVAAQRADRANDPELHTDRTMFSCGSLAPKLSRGGSCMDHGFAREKEPWEASDGAVFMLRELSDVAPEEVVRFLPQLADIARLTHFAHAVNLQETIWKVLPVIATRVGKKVFKIHLEIFLEPMFRGLTCGHRLCESAAGRCVGELRDLIGPGIFEGRLSEEQKEAMKASQDVPAPRGALAGGGLGGGGVSMPRPAALRAGV